MGQKDFQQLAIIRKLISDLHMPILLEMCPTVREPNGLAMSSRNTRLSQHAREEASIIYRTLGDAQQMFEENEPIEEIKRKTMAAMTKENFVPEYFEIVDGVTLKDIHSRKDSQYVVACCAIRVEDVRLIDNAIWTRPE
jgi:pantoate--beta-alanine ligase